MCAYAAALQFSHGQRGGGMVCIDQLIYEAVYLSYDLLDTTWSILRTRLFYLFTFVEMTRPQITPTLKKTKLQKNEKQTPDLDQLLSVQSFKQVPGLATS